MDGNMNPQSGGLPPSGASAIPSSEQSQSLRRKSNDVGWEYGMLIDPSNADKISCRLCGKNMSGGVYRLKEHVAGIPGNVAKCLKAKEIDKKKCKEAIIEGRNKKNKKKVEDDLMRAEINIRSRQSGSEQESNDDEANTLHIGGSRKEAYMIGAMDKFTKTINPEATVCLSRRQQNINDSLYKERLNEVYKWIGRWAYRHNVPLNAIDNEDWNMMVEAIGQFGPGLRGPSHYQLSNPILQKEVEFTNEMLSKQKDEWSKGGCSVMTDAWTDRKRRSIMNLCVNCRLGTSFVSTKECHGDSHTGELICEYVKKSIIEVGEKNVIQVVTDNASNNMAAAKLLKKEMPNIFWTSCASHTINLMLEAIGNLPRYKKTIDQAKSYTIFIYAHHKTLALMRHFTRKRELVRAGVTRFASSFLTLQSLLENKDSLKVMFNSDEWRICKFSKTKKGKEAFETTISALFWNGVRTCLKVFAPLVRVLRLADADHKPSMAWFYGELIKAKENIRVAFNNVENNYRIILDIIDSRAKGRLDSPLHLVGYLLNPYYLYKDDKIAQEQDLLDGLIACVETFFPGQTTLHDDIILIDFVKYKNKDGPLGKPLAIRALDRLDFDPVEWWKLNGNMVPNLQTIAVKVLGLTTSSSGCERNWSSFEGIHTKKRNRLTSPRLHDLVFVQFNARLMRLRTKLLERSIDVLRGEDGEAAAGWIVKGGDEDDYDVSRTLEDEFVSEEEEEDKGEDDMAMADEYDDFAEDDGCVRDDIYGEDDEMMQF